MNDQMASAVVEIRAVTREPESIDSVTDMHHVVISMHERIVESSYVVRCTLSGVSSKGHQIACIVNVRPIGIKPEAELQYMLRRVCRHLKRMANERNLGFTVSHSTYDLFVAQEHKNVKERKSPKAPRANRREHSTHTTFAAGVLAGI
ncbi:hypothetical protein pEaSNUABM5_00320 [Erwinia phage pEa_SNUABM_5]|uniref:Uncharacterized protein n=1 Tax=Erwinia phage pEa_SNUABM_5 TaxID=2797313 RepID=A0A7T8EQE5_9CAUD|nr:hypothetical protein MPK73_gp320 [Erwinia phage pEa_SNUABM_5]QQO90462.1 hypothetical protein pEaSNUABM5_00320 [Erwinia phage pEa_SNUABM_5]